KFELKLFFLARPAVVMIFRSTSGGRSKMGISPAALTALGGQIALARLGEIENGVAGLGIEELSPDRHAYRYILAVLAVAVRTLAVVPAFGLMFRVITKVEQGIEPLVGF